MKRVLTILFILLTYVLNAQVGIGTNTPTEDLEVVGKAKLSGTLTLENPGGFPIINDQRLLIELSSGEINRYDVSSAKYGPLNFVKYKFNDLDSHGLLDYDTKIPTSKYFMGLQSWYYEGTSGSTSVYHKASSGDLVNGLVARAYEKSGTWWLQFYCNDSQFYETGSFRNVNLTLGILVYRKNLLTSTDGTTITVDMGGSDTKLTGVAVPVGY